MQVRAAVERRTNHFRIDLKEQQAETETYRWEVDGAFFARLESTEVRDGSVEVSLQVHRKTSENYKLAFRFRGEVEVLCDRCLEPMMLPIEGEREMRVRLGQGADDGDDRMEDSDGVVDVEWNIYEMIVLQLPLRHVHEDGECRGETADALSHYIIERNND